MPTELRCRRCGSPFQDRDVLEELAIAKCRSCGAVMDLMSRARGEPDAPRPTRPPVAMPERFQVERGPTSLSIEWRWFTPATLALIFFCLCWDGFLVFWYSVASRGRNVVALVFPVIHVAVGAVMSWTALCQVFNRTRVTVEQGTLRIRHFPLPWPGSRELDTSDLEQLYSTEVVHRSKNGTTFTYDLMAMLKSDAKRLKLVRGLSKPEQALFLEQSLESFLHIEDVPVVGELPKTG